MSNSKSDQVASISRHGSRSAKIACLLLTALSVYLLFGSSSPRVVTNLEVLNKIPQGAKHYPLRDRDDLPSSCSLDEKILFDRHFTIAPSAPTALAKRFLREIIRHQYCSNDCSGALVFPDGMRGFGARVLLLAGGVMSAVAFGFNFRDLPGWKLSSCDDTSHACYFSTLSACEAAISASTRSRFYASLGNIVDKHSTHVFESFSLDAPILPKGYPPQAWFWLVAYTHLYLLQPRPDILAQVNSSIGLVIPSHWKRNETLFMHVRHGDKGIESDLFPFSQYIKIAERMYDTYGFRNVYVATDDPDVTDQILQGRVVDSRLRWTYNNHTARFNGFAMGRVEQNHSLAQSEMMSILTDLYAAALRCDGFIGTFSSNFSRMVLLFMSALRSRIPPHHSLDRWSESDIDAAAPRGSGWHPMDSSLPGGELPA